MTRKRREHSVVALEDSLNIFQNESDRACAILGSAHLEFLLKKVIEKQLVDDKKVLDQIFNGSNAPLSTLSSRIDIAYTLRIFGEKVKDELHIIRKIRNTFAHELEAHNFDSDQSTKDLCANLERSLAYANTLKEPHKTRMLQARNLYIYAIIMISDELKVISGVLTSKPYRPLLYKSISKTIPGDHLYTTSSDERDKVVRKHGYKEENIACYVYSTQRKATVPLYRLHHPMIGDHFYTTSRNEQERAIGRHGYRAEKVECYVYDQQENGTVPLFRAYNPANGDHFYTISEIEWEQAVMKYGYRPEDIACYVFESVHEGTVPLFRLLRTT